MGSSGTVKLMPERQSALCPAPGGGGSVSCDVDAALVGGDATAVAAACTQGLSAICDVCLRLKSAAASSRMAVSLVQVCRHPGARKAQAMEQAQESGVDQAPELACLCSTLVSVSGCAEV